MLSLDENDAKILEALHADGRAPLSTIARKTGIPRDSINYRIKRMQKAGVIKGFVVICDAFKLGYPVFSWVNVILQNHTREKEKKFKQHLQEISEVVYIAKTTGRYHYMIAIAASSVSDFDEILLNVFSKYPEMIKEYNSSLIVEEVQYDTFYRLVHQKLLKENTRKSS